jgi:uncharacterized protein (TIGR02186 family)
VNQAARILVALLALFVLSAQRDPILVPEVSQHEVRVRQGFTGTTLLLFGAILDPSGARSAGEYDIAVVVKGPTGPIRIREKQRILGMWVNAESSDFRSVPAFYAVSSSRAISEIVDGRTAAIYELGLDSLQLSPSGTIDPEEQARFSRGLTDLMQRQGLYQEDGEGVSISEEVLYQARISMPSNVQTGFYTAETFAIRDGRVIASATADIEVKKLGFERFVALFAEHQPFFYGLLAVALSIAMGWAAGRVFAMV